MDRANGTEANTTLDPLMSSGLFYLNSLDRSISNIRGVGYILILSCMITVPVLNAKIYLLQSLHARLSWIKGEL